MIAVMIVVAGIARHWMMTAEPPTLFDAVFLLAFALIPFLAYLMFALAGFRVDRVDVPRWKLWPIAALITFLVMSIFFFVLGRH